MNSTFERLTAKLLADGRITRRLPDTPEELSRQLRELMPALLTVGLRVVFTYVDGEERITITKV